MTLPSRRPVRPPYEAAAGDANRVAVIDQ